MNHLKVLIQYSIQIIQVDDAPVILIRNNQNDNVTVNEEDTDGVIFKVQITISIVVDITSLNQVMIYSFRKFLM